MKWAYSIQHKVKIALCAAIILVVFFAKNWIDKGNVATLDDSFASVYDDRLVVESYIYLLSDHLYQKKISITNCNVAPSVKLVSEINYHNEAIDRLLVDYEKTKLTKAESKYFANLKYNLSALRSLEEGLTDHQASNSAASLDKVQDRFAIVLTDLNQLSQIQLNEGKRLRDQSKQIAAGSVILTNFELAVIVAVGLIIQVLLFASKSTIPRMPFRPGLN